MRQFVLAIVALLGLAGAAHAAFGIFQTYSGPPQIICNIVTGVASVGGPCTSTTTCNGSGDDAPAFKAFNVWARANQGSSNQVVLTVPNGSSCVFNSNQSISGTTILNAYWYGLNNVITEGTGAAFSGTNGVTFGSFGQCQRGLASASGCSARIQSASASALTVTLTAASLSAGYISRFSVGAPLLVGGIDPQAFTGDPTGFPTNLTIFEYRQITNVNAGTGVITLDRPLTYSYLDTWPEYNAGSAGESDKGGPATIWAFDSAWNTTQEYRGLTVTQTGQMNARGRYITFRNAFFVGASGNCGPFPQQNEIFTSIGSNWDQCTIEMDKLIDTVIIDSTTIKTLDTQSSSTNSFIARNGTSITGNLAGTPTNATITDTTINQLKTGATSYGASIGLFSCIRCKVTTFQDTGGISQAPNPSLTSMSGGVISFLNSDNTAGNGPPARVFVPGGKLFFTATGYASLGIFSVVAMTQDATNTYIQTNQAGGFPDLTTLGGSPIGFLTHQAYQFTCTDPDPASDPTFIATCTNAGAVPGAPRGTYSRRSFTPTVQTNNLGSLPVKGKILSLTVDVTTASTHTAGAIQLNPTGQSHNFTIKQSNWTTFDWMPTINAKQAGTRVYTNSGGGAGSWTCNGVPGGCSGDTVTGAGIPPEQVWMQSGISPGIFGTFTGGVNPTFTITIQTDQTP